MRNKLFILFLIFSAAANGQLLYPSALGGIVMKDSNMAQINYTFVDSGKCLLLSNGLSLFPKRINYTKFTPACPEIPNFKPCPLIAYPNPAKDFSTVQTVGGCFNTYVWLKGRMVVLTALGQEILSKEILVDDLRKGIKVDLRRFAAGVYFVHITFQNTKQNLKIIKSHD